MSKSFVHTKHNVQLICIRFFSNFYSLSQVSRRVKTFLLQCATPDSVMRLSESKLLAQEVKQIKDDYFNQEHSSLISYLQHQLDPACHQEGTTKDIMAHVSFKQNTLLLLLLLLFFHVVLVIM